MTRALIANKFVTAVTGKAENLEPAGGGDNKPYQRDQEALEMFPRCLDRQRGMVSREYWDESLPESVQMVEENKSWSEPVPGFQIVESGTFHYLNAWNRIGVDENDKSFSPWFKSIKIENAIATLIF